jgi:hypothetical protein
MAGGKTARSDTSVGIAREKGVAGYLAPAFNRH